MTPEHFTFMQGFLKERSRLVLGNDKGYLLESRLTPIARRHDIKDLDELVAKAMSAPTEALLVDIRLSNLTSGLSDFS